MTIIRFLLTQIILVFAGISLLSAQDTLYVKDHAGLVTPYNLPGLRKIYFAGQEMTVEITPVPVQTYLISEIRTLSFRNYIAGIPGPEPALSLNVKLYPNPAESFLTIEMSMVMQSGWSVWIISLDGKVLSDIHVSGQRVSMDVENLKRGSYICRIWGGTRPFSVPFIKN